MENAEVAEGAKKIDLNARVFHLVEIFAADIARADGVENEMNGHTSAGFFGQKSADFPRYLAFYEGERFERDRFFGVFHG